MLLLLLLLLQLRLDDKACTSETDSGVAAGVFGRTGMFEHVQDVVVFFAKSLLFSYVRV